MQILNTGTNTLKKGKHGYYLYNVHDIYIGQAIEQYGEFCESEYNTFKAIVKPGDHVMDLGANMGMHTMTLSKLVGPAGKVYAFEPQRVIFQILCSNIALNSLLNVHTYHAALDTESGTINIPSLDYEKSNNFGGLEIDKSKTGDKVTVMTLDQLLDDMPKLNFIKLDVEGMEEKVLRGGVKVLTKFHPSLYVENDRLQKSQSLIECLWEMGYELYWHISRLYNPNNFFNNPKNIYNDISAFNMLCIHKSKKIAVQGLEKITDSSQHQLKKETTSNL
jgi:FkbM family methyltransferase